MSLEQIKKDREKLISLYSKKDREKIINELQNNVFDDQEMLVNTILEIKEKEKQEALEAQKNKIMGAITKRRKEVNILSPQGADRFVADIIEIIKKL